MAVVCPHCLELRGIVLVDLDTRENSPPKISLTDFAFAEAIAPGLLRAPILNPFHCSCGHHFEWLEKAVKEGKR